MPFPMSCHPSVNGPKALRHFWLQELQDLGQHCHIQNECNRKEEIPMAVLWSPNQPLLLPICHKREPFQLIVYTSKEPGAKKMDV